MPSASSRPAYRRPHGLWPVRLQCSAPSAPGHSPAPSARPAPRGSRDRGNSRPAPGPTRSPAGHIPRRRSHFRAACRTHVPPAAAPPACALRLYAGMLCPRPHDAAERLLRKIFRRQRHKFSVHFRLLSSTSPEIPAASVPSLPSNRSFRRSCDPADGGCKARGAASRGRGTSSGRQSRR